MTVQLDSAPRPRWRLRALVPAAAAAVLGAGGVLLAAPAHAAGETVNIWLTTTNDSGGRNVTAGLRQQASISFVGPPGGARALERCR
ncbi:hypothetical protein GTS_54790 [Gandjariella thermophila]|uniref:Uncharacterized protein n=1 Tax=Gandjariella thermophila TaxID=1931992 RepID=A0A4D4JHH6_9PSEU|nr:hypothetical protein GTS_54790 [Gandjariella thermophila]